MDWTVIAIAGTGVLGVWCVQRVRRDFRLHDRLSATSVSIVWAFDLVHFAASLVAAASSTWALPIRLAVALGGGLLLLAGGASLFAAGLMALGSLRRTCGLDTASLVTTGVYRWTRNPQIVGWTLCLAGIAFIGRSGLALLLATVFWGVSRAYLGEEEALLERLHGEEYRRYRACSRRIFGVPRTPVP